MSVFAIELDDRAVSLARGGRVLSSAPSTVFNGSDGRQEGFNAWRELRSRPMATSSRHLGAVLKQPGVSPRASVSTRAEALITAELKLRLADHPTTASERVWIITPARSDAAGLAALLGITRRIGLPVDGFIDAAAMTTAVTESRRNAIVLELGLHHTAATSVDCEGGQARRRRAVLTERGGFLELYQTWLDLVSTTMVKRTRFDPLHDASTEQQLFDALPHLAVEATTAGSTTAAVTKGKQRFEVALTRDQFARAAEPLYRAMVGLLHQLRPAGAPVTITVPKVAASLPGLRELLEQFVECELVTVEDGFAAAAASLLDLPEHPATGDSVSLLRRIPLKTPAAAPDSSAARESLGQQRTSGPPPSHVLWDGRAYSLTTDSLVVGRSFSDSARHITLPDGLAGVSRRHCTFVHDGDELVLLDHSSFGTFVNGERVLERVRVHAGDRVKLGEPGVELALIAVGDATGQ